MNNSKSQPNNSSDRFSVEQVTAWIGSVPSLVAHSVVFSCFFLTSVLGLIPWSFMLLVLTTILSLEAIYLAIFIQFTVNRHTKELEEVSEDVEDIQEDIEEISEDVEDIQEDVEEMGEEITEGDEGEMAHAQKQEMVLEQLTKDVQRLLAELEQLKKGK